LQLPIVDQNTTMFPNIFSNQRKKGHTKINAYSNYQNNNIRT
jgi:hypothetical protein